MPDINYAAVIVSTLVTFVGSSVWYVVFSKARAKLARLDLAAERRPQPAKILVELVRTVIVAFVFATILGWIGGGSGEAFKLALLLWLAFPAELLSGSVMWDKVPAKLAAIHAGDWLLKLLIIAAIVGSWV